MLWIVSENTSTTSNSSRQDASSSTSSRDQRVTTRQEPGDRCRSGVCDLVGQQVPHLHNTCDDTDATAPRGIGSSGSDTGCSRPARTRMSRDPTSFFDHSSHQRFDCHIDAGLATADTAVDFADRHCRSREQLVQRPRGQRVCPMHVQQIRRCAILYHACYAV
jgi:hypothetical protein